jgi:hypothetical protein
MLPAQYRWLESEPGPRMIVEALKEYGTLEAPGAADNPKIIGWQNELEAAGLGRVYAGVCRHDAIPWCGLFMAIAALRSNHCGVLDRQNMPPRNPPRRGRPSRPHHLFRRNGTVAQKTAQADLASPIPAQPPHTHPTRAKLNKPRLQKDPPFSRRRSPNRPKPSFILATLRIITSQVNQTPTHSSIEMCEHCSLRGGEGRSAQ